MARTIATLPRGSRITDYISIGVIAKSFPLEKVNEVLGSTGKMSQRQRDLPAHVVVYYILALALFMQVSYQEVLRCLLEGIEWLAAPGSRVKVTGKSGISQARTRLGSGPLKELHDAVVKPIADKETKGAWYRDWRLVTLDGSTMETADNLENETAFGRPGASRGMSAYPQIRFVSLVENGTHVLFGTQLADCHTSEATLAREVVSHLKGGMLCLADRYFFGFELWQKACGNGADLLWRVRRNAVLPCLKRLPDGSYLSRIYAATAKSTALPTELMSASLSISWRVTVRKKSIVWSPPFWIQRLHLPRNWLLCTPSAGRSRPLWTNSRPICVAHESNYAARPPTSSSRNSTAS